MARVKGLMQITGNMKGVSMYTMRGSEEVIIRTKGGPSKRTIKTRESCKALRNNGMEWKGCTKTASVIRRAVEPLLRVADYNVMGALNALCKKIQCFDVENEQGKRSVLLTRHRELFVNFDFNKTNPFDRVIRLVPNWEIDRATVTATVTIPAFEPDLHLVAPNKLPLMRWMVALGVATDMVMNQHQNGYEYANDILVGYRREERGEWSHVKRSLPEQTLIVDLPKVAPYLKEGDTLILSIGVEFGNVGVDGQGEAVKYAGCAKMLGGA